MKRQRGRNRKQPSMSNRTLESNGPDVKLRGSAQTIFEKYQQLARDAQSSGDRIKSENLLQHAEHYYRIYAAQQAQNPQPRDQGRPRDQDQRGGGEEGGQHREGRERDQRERGGASEDPLSVVEPGGGDFDAASDDQPDDFTPSKGGYEARQADDEAPAKRSGGRPPRGRRGANGSAGEDPEAQAALDLTAGAQSKASV